MPAVNQSFPQRTKPPAYTVPETATFASFAPDQKYEPMQVAASGLARIQPCVYRMERNNFMGNSRFILQAEGVAGPSSAAAPELMGFVQPPPAFFIKRRGLRPYALYEGPEPPKKHRDEGKLLDFSDEGGIGAFRKVFGLLTTAAVMGFIGWIKTNSYYTEAGGLARTARMYKMKDDEKNRNAWYSSDRTLEDFQGNRYKFDTSIMMNNLTIINLSDNTTIATFKRPIAGITHQGTLEIQQPITLEFLHLLLGACYIKYLTDQRSRAAAGSSGGGGGSGGG
ncbi:hypothetical protein FRC00_007090 [Tulasnella sp. 408]|nr:hypothetical protein FRC00_007090 [Tulasnella sp. 408]